MKTQSKACLISIVPLVAIALGICFATAENPKPLKALNLEQSQGEVRVILLRAGWTASTNNAKPLVITCAIEVPVKGAFSDLHFNSADEIALTGHGKAVEFHSVSSATMDLKDLPRQSELTRPATREGRAMIAEELTLNDIHLDAKQIDVKLHFLWRGNEMNFDFKDVPLN